MSFILGNLNYYAGTLSEDCEETEPEMPEVYWYFKLFNSIKEKHELTFAQLELIGLFGNVDPVRNYADILEDTPFRNFMKGNARVQDFFAHELPYGEYHGFLAKTSEARDVSQLVMRLAYTREFFALTEANDLSDALQHFFPKGVTGKNVELFQSNGFILLRFITNQYFLEKSQYISKLSRNEEEAENNVNSLLSFLTKQLSRIPATETMQIGKRLEDYFAIREEPSLYLAHYMHPYKGKFHPKMVRALLNYAFPRPTGKVMDNFAGCGTLLVEATWMGLNSVGVEINPLSALMCNVKCESLVIPADELKKGVTDYLQNLRSNLLSYDSESSGSTLLVKPDYDKDSVKKAKETIPTAVARLFSETNTAGHVIVAHELIKKVNNDKIRDFLLLALSGAISDLTRRRKGNLLDILDGRLRNLFLRIYIFSKLNDVLRIELGKSVTYAADNRDMKMVEDESIDAIVNSPPYSTALDYIKNDFPQLTLLELADISKLEVNMIGNPRFKVYPQSLLKEIQSNSSDYTNLPQNAREVVSTLIKYGRTKEAVRTYKFFKDMYLSLKEMYRVLKRPSKCVIVLGNNHYKLDGNYAVVKNDEVLKEMALMLGFREDRTIVRELEKSQAGMIRYESILILEKQPT
jgi:tRNA G10  N-methylase Trm11